MFAPRSRPLAFDAENLLGLRLSLNAPVVATPELPAGPARAAIVIHRDAGGVRRCVVGVRSLRNGSTVLYELEGEDLEDASGLAVAVDAALSFAESMGFLFDDDELEGGGEDAAKRAVLRWRELVGPPATSSEPEPSTGGVGADIAADLPPLAEDPEELTLEPVDTPEEMLLEQRVDEAQGKTSDTSEPSAIGGSLRRDAARLLTKFRGRKSTPAPPTVELHTPAGTALGRVRLVRRTPEKENAPSGLIRLIAAF